MRHASLFAMCLSLLVAPRMAAADAPEKSCHHPKPEYRCPTGLERRTPEQVWADRVDAMARGDLDRVMCDYANDAVVLTPAGAARGKVEIRAALEMLFNLLGGTLPTVTSLNVEGPVLFVTFTVTTPIISILDGADTYVIKHGRIHYQTAHDPITFNAPPPAPAADAEPAAAP